jgi:hypothetical protein
MMKNRRAKYDKRRQRYEMPTVPFMDDHGVMVSENRRKLPDRRKGNTQTMS